MQEVIYLMQSQQWFFLLTVGLVSLCIGSFLNVVIYRLPIMMKRAWQQECRLSLADELANSSKQTGASNDTFNLIKPNSTCPHCQTPIKAWHNIPLLGWLMLRGKCASCLAKISVRYPLVELGTALVSLWVALQFGATELGLLYIFITWVLVALIFIDIDHMLLPDQLTLSSVWLALIASVMGYTIAPSEAIIGAAVGYLSLWTVFWAFKLLTGKEGMGYGDFKLLAIFGALLGWQAILTIVLLSSVVGAVIGSIQLAVQGKEHNTPIPFGPYLAIAGWLAMLYGTDIQTWYISLLS